ncbi:MAG: FAD-dependent oxidoreductase, partial [Mesorhizobium sp.]
LIPSYTRNINVGRMIKKTTEIYEGLEAETGQPVGWHKCGQLRIANSRDRLDEFKSYMSVADVQGMRAELLTPGEARQLAPLLDNDHMLGALYHPDDGHIAPADVTIAMAKGARDLGAKVYLNTEVTGFRRTPGGEWLVQTNKGDITCEHVISATGNYARQTGALLGLDIPAIPILHQYWITEVVPEIVERKRQGRPEMPILRDEGFEGYLREEGDGLMFGPYERTANLKLFAEDGVPSWFGADLVEEDFEAVSWNWEQALQLVPALGRVGIKANVRGPFQMTADELPLMGPAWGLPNVWLAEGVPGGILWGGTIGYYLSERIVEGGNSLDTSDLDPRRFGDYANKAWTREKVREAWGTHAEQKYPGQDMPAARPQKTAPSYDRLTELGAVWGVLNGWEMPNWFARDGVEAKDQYSWRWTPKGNLVAQEVQAVRTAVGLVEMTPMTKFEVSGPSAAAWLDRIIANCLPAVGKVTLAHHLTAGGGVQAEYMVARLGEDLFYLISTPRAERWNFDDLSRLLPADGSISLKNVTNDRGCFTVVGPKAREVLQPLTEIDLSNEKFPWFSVATGSVALASDVRLLRVNYEGELGWELYVSTDQAAHVFEAIIEAGADVGLKLCGLHTLDSCRIEKAFRHFGHDITDEDHVLEAGLGFAVKTAKSDFIGRDAVLRKKEAGLSRRLVQFRLKDPQPLLFHNEAILRDGMIVGPITSGNYGHHIGGAIGLGYVPCEGESEADVLGSSYEVEIAGERFAAEASLRPMYDPKAERVRM